MGFPLGLSAQAMTVVVLALAEQPATWRYGHELGHRLDLEPGPSVPATTAPGVGGIGRRPRLEGT